MTPTKHCTQCRVGFDKEGRPEYQALAKTQAGFWCCPCCGASYGTNPHPDLT